MNALFEIPLGLLGSLLFLVAVMCALLALLVGLFASYGLLKKISYESKLLWWRRRNSAARKMVAGADRGRPFGDFGIYLHAYSLASPDGTLGNGRPPSLPLFNQLLAEFAGSTEEYVQRGWQALRILEIGEHDFQSKRQSLEHAIGQSISFPMVALGRSNEAHGIGVVETEDGTWWSLVGSLLWEAKVIFVLPGKGVGISKELNAISRDPIFLSKSVFILLSHRYKDGLSCIRSAGLSVPDELAAPTAKDFGTCFTYNPERQIDFLRRIRSQSPETLFLTLTRMVAHVVN